MTQRKSNQSQNIMISGLDDKVYECVKYIFCRGGSKQPIKRPEITKHLTDTYQVTKEQVEYILQKAKGELKRVYGYNLVELKGTDTKQYIIVLDQPEEECLSSFTNPLHRRQLVAALTHIFMTSGPVSEDEMWKFLTEAYVMKENDHNERKNFTNMFTKQLYLTRTKVGEGVLQKFTFEWGPRAHEELPKMYILKKVAEALKKNPTDWSEQYKICSSNSIST